MDLFGDDGDGMGFLASIKRPSTATDAPKPGADANGPNSSKAKKGTLVDDLLKDNDEDFFKQFSVGDDDLDASNSPAPAPAAARKSTLIPDDEPDEDMGLYNAAANTTIDGDGKPGPAGVQDMDGVEDSHQADAGVAGGTEPAAGAEKVARPAEDPAPEDMQLTMAEGVAVAGGSEGQQSAAKDFVQPASTDAEQGADNQADAAAAQVAQEAVAPANVSSPGVAPATSPTHNSASSAKSLPPCPAPSPRTSTVQPTVAPANKQEAKPLPVPAAAVAANVGVGSVLAQRRPASTLALPSLLQRAKRPVGTPIAAATPITATSGVTKAPSTQQQLATQPPVQADEQPRPPVTQKTALLNAASAVGGRTSPNPTPAPSAAPTLAKSLFRTKDPAAKPPPVLGPRPSLGMPPPPPVAALQKHTASTAAPGKPQPAPDSASNAAGSAPAMGPRSVVGSSSGASSLNLLSRMQSIGAARQSAATKEGHTPGALSLTAPERSSLVVTAAAGGNTAQAGAAREPPGNALTQILGGGRTPALVIRAPQQQQQQQGAGHAITPPAAKEGEINGGGSDRTPDGGHAAGVSPSLVAPAAGATPGGGSTPVPCTTPDAGTASVAGSTPGAGITPDQAISRATNVPNAAGTGRESVSPFFTPTTSTVTSEQHQQTQRQQVAVAATPDALLQAKLPGRPLKPPPAMNKAARPTGVAEAGAGPGVGAAQSIAGLPRDTVTPPPGAFAAGGAGGAGGAQPTPSPPCGQGQGGPGVKRSLASPLDRMLNASPAGQIAADSSSAMQAAAAPADVHPEVPPLAAEADSGSAADVETGAGASSAAAGTGAAQSEQQDVAMVVAQGALEAEFETAVAREAPSRPVAVAGNIGGGSDGGEAPADGFAGFTPLPPAKRTRPSAAPNGSGGLPDTTQLPANYLGAIRALELKIAESQQMQVAVMELRVKAAMSSNRLVMLDNPVLRRGLKALTQRAHDLMELVQQPRTVRVD